MPKIGQTEFSQRQSAAMAAKAQAQKDFAAAQQLTDKAAREAAMNAAANALGAAEAELLVLGNLTVVPDSDPDLQ